MTAQTKGSNLKVSAEPRTIQNESSGASKNRKNTIGVLRSNATQLALKDDDKAGSRVPGGDAFLPNSQTA